MRVLFNAFQSTGSKFLKACKLELKYLERSRLDLDGLNKAKEVECRWDQIQKAIHAGQERSILFPFR